MTSILELLQSRDIDFSKPFFIDSKYSLCLNDVIDRNFEHLKDIKQGDVVALIGDFNENSIADLLQLIERKVILVPLTSETISEHHYFFDCAKVEWIVENGTSRQIGTRQKHPLLNELRLRKNPGLILFSTGTTGRPKAILHDFSFFLQRYLTPRPALVTLNFLLFDHIGGINTLLHSMFNSGLIVSIKKRSVEQVLKTCEDFMVEVLPTTPTFLRMMLMSGLIAEKFPKSLKVITYGTERMDQFTLLKLAEILPSVDFRQTFGMSELGILRVKSESRTSLFMRVGGEGVTWRVDDGVLKIQSSTRMMGYLNADSPFDQDGWYDTKDLVEVKGDFLKVVGRTMDVVNVAGLKFLTSEVESIAVNYPGISDLNIFVKTNPITGQHIEMTVHVLEGVVFDKEGFKEFLSSKLPRHMVPQKILLGEIAINHRFKKGR
jgi:acyl-CoA synthetase (AMP-forming)/AMP-acid ligase II